MMNSESFISVDSQLKQLEKRLIITLQVWNPQNTIVKGKFSSNSVEIILAVGCNHFLLYFLFLPNNSGHIYWVAFPNKKHKPTSTKRDSSSKYTPNHGPDFSANHATLLNFQVDSHHTIWHNPMELVHLGLVLNQSASFSSPKFPEKKNIRWRCDPPWGLGDCGVCLLECLGKSSP